MLSAFNLNTNTANGLTSAHGRRCGSRWTAWHAGNRQLTCETSFIHAPNLNMSKLSRPKGLSLSRRCLVPNQTLGRQFGFQAHHRPLSLPYPGLCSADRWSVPKPFQLPGENWTPQTSSRSRLPFATKGTQDLGGAKATSPSSESSNLKPALRVRNRLKSRTSKLTTLRLSACSIDLMPDWTGTIAYYPYRCLSAYIQALSMSICSAPPEKPSCIQRKPQGFDCTNSLCVS